MWTRFFSEGSAGSKGIFRALRISRDAAGVGKFLKVIWAIPIAAPLPDITSHVVEAVGIGGKRFHRRNTCKSILAGIFDRKLSLVGVCHELSAWFEFIAPHIELAAQASPSCEFPLGFRRQSLACPFRVGYRVGVGDLHNRIVFPALNVALWTVGVPPVRALLVAPPSVMVGQRHRAGMWE